MSSDAPKTTEISAERETASEHFGRLGNTMCDLIANYPWGRLERDFKTLKEKEPETYAHFAPQMSLLLTMADFFESHAIDVYADMKGLPAGKDKNYLGKTKREYYEEVDLTFRTKRPKFEPPSTSKEQQQETKSPGTETKKQTFRSSQTVVVTDEWTGTEQPSSEQQQQ